MLTGAGGVGGRRGVGNPDDIEEELLEPHGRDVDTAALPQAYPVMVPLHEREVAQIVLDAVDALQAQVVGRRQADELAQVDAPDRYRTSPGWTKEAVWASSAAVYVLMESLCAAPPGRLFQWPYRSQWMDG